VDPVTVSRLQNMVKRICLISPGHVAFNPRLIKEADALCSAGYAVHVIAANNLRHLRSLDEPILATAKWSFELVGGGSALRDVVRRGRTKISKSVIRVSHLENLQLHEWAHHSLTGLLKSAACRHQADLYIAHYIAALPAAYFAARRFKSLWGFDAEDYHLGEFERVELEGVPARAVQKIERAYLPQASYFTAASEGIARAYARDHGISAPQVILNVFPRANAPQHPTKTGHARPGPSIYWFSQTIGTNRGLECAIQAVAKAKSKPHLYLRGNFQAGIKEKLSDIAEPLGVGHRLHYLPVALGADLERLASEYDVGLVAETGYTENRQIALTNKLFSFLLAGVAVVASDTLAHRTCAKVCSAVHLYSAESSCSLANVIDDLLLDPRALERARCQSWAAGQKWYNWDLEQRKLLQVICSQIGPSGKTQR
jgi:glycosyltransferase involved in cell wall biosynthesis